MAHLKDVIAYICEKYPHKNELSKARLTKLVYLADWRSAITRAKQLTPITWTFNHFGPYIDDVVTLARSDPDFDVVKGSTIYGDEKEVIRLRSSIPCTSLTAEDRTILDFVIQSTQSKFWDAFIRLVYSTYPILSQPRFTNLDLVKLAQEYKAKEEMIQ